MSRPTQLKWLPWAGVALTGLLFFRGVSVAADSIFLQGGEHLVGQVISTAGAGVVFESQNLGRVEIPWERVKLVDRAEVVVVLESTNQFFPWVEDTTTNRFDWIQLKSGEWLKGRLKSLQDDKLEFDSEKLDLQEFDWEDVWQVHAPRQNEALFEDKKKVAGPIRITRHQVLVQTSQGEQTYARTNLIAVTPGGPREINYWSGNIAAGMTLRAGNTEQTEFHVSAELKRRTPDTRFTLNHLGNISRLENQEVANNNRVTAQFDVWLSRHLYVKIPLVEYYRDPIQNIEHRGTAGGGVGYEFFDRPRLKWDVVIGPAYQQIWYDSVAPGERTTEGNPALLFQSLLDTKISHRIDFISQYQVILTPPENGGYTHHWQNTFEIELNKRLDLNVSLIWDRVSNPSTSSAGVEAKSDDFRTVISLGVNF